MNKKITTINLLILSMLLLSSCNTNNSDLKTEQINAIYKNIDFDKEMNTMIELAKKDEKNKDKKTENSLILKNILSNYKDLEKKAEKPKNIYLDYNYFDNPHYVSGENTNIVNLYGIDWNIYQEKNVDDLVSVTLLMTKFPRSQYSLNEIEDKIKLTTEKIIKANGSPFYAINPNIDLRRDNSKLKDMIKDLQDDKKSEEVDLHSLQSNLEANRSSLLFEGEDFYLNYIIYNDAINNNYELSLGYISKNSYHHNNWIKSYYLNELEDAIIEYKGYSDLPMSYAEPNGKIIKYKKDRLMTNDEKDQLRYTLFGGSNNNDVSNKELRDDKKEVKEWINEEMNNREKIKEIQDKPHINKAVEGDDLSE